MRSRIEPARHPFGMAQLPGKDALARREIRGRAAEQRLQLPRQFVAVEPDGVGLLHFLDRAALHKQPLHRKERRELIVCRL